MPDTDDEGSVADSVADTGGATMAAGDTRGGDEDNMKVGRRSNETWYSSSWGCISHCWTFFLGGGAGGFPGAGV